MLDQLLAWINVSATLEWQKNRFDSSLHLLTQFDTFSIFVVFMEKGVIDNQTTAFANDIIPDESLLDVPTYDINNKKVLIASRHTRNDSKGIQLEFRYIYFLAFALHRIEMEELKTNFRLVIFSS